MALKYTPLSFTERQERANERQFEQSLTRRLEDVRNELETNVTESPILDEAVFLLIRAANFIHLAVQAPLPPEEASEPEDEEPPTSNAGLHFQIQELRSDIDRMSRKLEKLTAKEV